MLTSSLDYAALAEVDRRDRIFQSYADIVNGIGQTFAGTLIEILSCTIPGTCQARLWRQNPFPAQAGRH